MIKAFHDAILEMKQATKREKKIFIIALVAFIFFSYIGVTPGGTIRLQLLVMGHVREAFTCEISKTESDRIYELSNPPIDKNYYEPLQYWCTGIRIGTMTVISRPIAEYRGDKKYEAKQQESKEQ